MSIIIRGGASGALAEVESTGELRTVARLSDVTSGGLPVRFGSQGPVALNIPAGSAGIVVGPVDVTDAGNVTIIVKNTVADQPFDGSPHLVMEQSDDGVTWAALPVMRSDTNVIRHDRLLEPNVAGRQIMFDGETEGARFVRVRAVAGPATKDMTVVVQPGVFAFTPAVAIATPARTSLTLSAVNHSVGASGVENPLTLTRMRGGYEFVTGTSFVSPIGKVFRTQTCLISQVGNSTQNAASTIFRLRFNGLGAATVTSPVALQCRLATISEPGAYSSLTLNFGDGFDTMGDGVASFMWTVQSTFSGTLPPTVDFCSVGYEF